jgi:hypothetical protein
MESIRWIPRNIYILNLFFNIAIFSLIVTEDGNNLTLPYQYILFGSCQHIPKFLIKLGSLEEGEREKGIGSKLEIVLGHLISFCGQGVRVLTGRGAIRGMGPELFSDTPLSLPLPPSGSGKRGKSFSPSEYFLSIFI